MDRNGSVYSKQQICDFSGVAVHDPIERSHAQEFRSQLPRGSVNLEVPEEVHLVLLGTIQCGSHHFHGLLCANILQVDLDHVHHNILTHLKLNRKEMVNEPLHYLVIKRKVA